MSDSSFSEVQKEGSTDLNSGSQTDFIGEVLNLASSKANKIESVLGAAIVYVPRSLTRKNAINRLVQSHGIGPAADLLICVRLRNTAALIAIIAAICFYIYLPITIGLGIALDILSLTASIESSFRLRRSNIPRRRPFGRKPAVPH